MREHGVNVNPRHIYLLAEVMTCKGKVIGFTRNGVDKMKDSTIMLASFEKTTDFLFDAATQGKHDRMRGVSEKIIVGQPISIGTGMFDVLWDTLKKKIYWFILTINYFPIIIILTISRVKKILYIHDY